MSLFTLLNGFRFFFHWFLVVLMCWWRLIHAHTRMHWLLVVFSEWQRIKKKPKPQQILIIAPINNSPIDYAHLCCVRNVYMCDKRTHLMCMLNWTFCLLCASYIVISGSTRFNTSLDFICVLIAVLLQNVGSLHHKFRSTTSIQNILPNSRAFCDNKKKNFLCVIDKRF